MADCCLQDEALTFSPTLYPTAPLRIPRTSLGAWDKFLPARAVPLPPLALSAPFLWVPGSPALAPDRLQMG